ncbi:MAG TPA: hypothetical protein PKK10_09625 [Woeseiaceae bacterium]|nr:hypothetical protein [Woeseiaceae bacterium]
MNTAQFWVALFLSLMTMAATAEPALRPSQQAALNELLESMDPQLRPMMHDQLVTTLSMLNDEQIERLLAEARGGSGDNSEAHDDDQPPPAPATEQDLENNRKQYEPAIRKAWAASHSFDSFVEQKLAEHCAPRGTYAIYGSAWRFEVAEFAPYWPHASNNADLDVQIIGASYAPSDQAYDFDFSAMTTQFDEGKVSDSIIEACNRYNEIGKQFLVQAGTGTNGAPPANGQRAENSANAEVAVIRQALEQQLQLWPDRWTAPLYQALLNARPRS